jgi:hypothetical protein
MLDHLLHIKMSEQQEHPGKRFQRGACDITVLVETSDFYVMG